MVKRVCVCVCVYSAAGRLSMEEFISNNTALDTVEGQRSHCMFADGTTLYSGHSSGYLGDYNDHSTHHTLPAPQAIYRPDLYFKRPSYGVATERSEALFTAAVAVAAGEHTGAGYIMTAM